MPQSRKQKIGRTLNAAAAKVPLAAPQFDVATQRYFPIPQPDDDVLKRRLRRRQTFFCVVCGKRSLLRVGGNESLRETIACLHCRSIGRHRQLAAVILGSSQHYPSLAAYGASGRADRVYNTEADGALHDQLKNLPRYTCSEYKEGDYRSGQTIGDVVHQDLQATSYQDDSFDLVISSDVFEHIPFPYQAHREVWRILAPGGRHVMSVPFQFDAATDQVLAELDDAGKVTHLRPPVYHHDSLRPEGILTFRIFGLAMLAELETIGFDVRMYNLQQPNIGIVGKHAFIFELCKPAVAQE